MAGRTVHWEKYPRCPVCGMTWRCRSMRVHRWNWWGIRLLKRPHKGRRVHA